MVYFLRFPDFDLFEDIHEGTNAWLTLTSARITQLLLLLLYLFKLSFHNFSRQQHAYSVKSWLLNMSQDPCHVRL
jgi:hypothetical protein